MSRQRWSLRLAPVAMGIALALAGCSAGQISQTAGMEPAVNGGQGNAGPIAVRDIQLAYPEHGAYQAGERVALLGTIFNNSQSDDELLSISSPAGPVTIDGDRKLPPGGALLAEKSEKVPVTPSSTPSTTTSSQPPSSTGSTSTSTTSTGTTSATTTTPPRPTTSTANPADIGKISFVLVPREEIRPGKTIELTFTFRSGQVTISAPVAVPTTPRGEGH